MPVYGTLQQFAYSPVPNSRKVQNSRTRRANRDSNLQSQKYKTTARFEVSFWTYALRRRQSVSNTFKIRTFWVMYFHLSKSSPGLTVLLSHCISTQPPPYMRHLSCRRTSFSLPCPKDPCVLWYQPACHNCFHLAIIFKFVAAKTLLQRWKPTVSVRRRTALI
jgi:hypothetical protein